MKTIKILRTFIFHIYNSLHTEAAVEKTNVVFFCWKTIVSLTVVD